MSKNRFTVDEILMGRVKLADLPEDLQKNLAKLQHRTNIFFANYPKPLIVTSGYRPKTINKAIGGATNSLHQLCAALDIRDSNGEVWQFCLKNLELAKQIGLWFEDRRWTSISPDKPNGWVHLQIYPPKSGKIIFIPNSKPPINTKIWSGTY